MKQVRVQLPYQVDTTLDASLRELLARITPLCSHYSTVVQFCEEQAHPPVATGAVSGTGSGRVNQALAGALYSLIKDYYIFVTQVRVLVICAPSTRSLGGIFLPYRALKDAVTY